MDLLEYEKSEENDNRQVILSLKEPDETDLHHFSLKTPILGGVLNDNGDTFSAFENRKGIEYDLEYNNCTKKSYDDELGHTVHIPKMKKRVIKQIILDDFGMDSPDEIEDENTTVNIDWHEVESVTRQSLCGSDKPLSSVDLLEEGINQQDIPKEFPQKSCYSTIHRLLISLFSSLRAYIKSFVKTNKKNQ